MDLRASHAGCVCSIDPPGCVDIDDALSVRDLGGGRLELGVHIADVTAFVAHGSALDLEARSRGTTVYLADRRLGHAARGAERGPVLLAWRHGPPGRQRSVGD